MRIQDTDHTTKMQERSLFVVLLVVFLLCALLTEAYFLHRTEQFFGGGALNRPFFISTKGEGAAFLLHAFAYDVLFYGTLGLALTRLPGLYRRVALLQRNVFAFLVLGYIFFIVLVGRWKLYDFFKSQFDLKILIDLASGDLRNIFGWIDLKQFAFVLALPVALVLLFALLRLLSRFPLYFQPWKVRRSLLLSIPIFWSILLVGHFLISGYGAHAFGLSKKLSYSTLDIVLSSMADLDDDGFSPLTSPVDPREGDGDIHPYAVDEPGNGIDENALAGDLPLNYPSISNEELVSLEKSNGRNVILIVVETFRVDVIGKIIDGQEVTPFLNALANEHAYTSYAYSNFGVTARAIQSLFKGSLDFTAETPSIADRLNDIGYETYAISAQDESWGRTDEIVGFERFQHFFDSRSIDWDNRSLTPYEKRHRRGLTLDSVELNEHVFEIIDAAEDRRFFLYINYQDLHYPYYAPHMEHVFIQSGSRTADFFQPDNVKAIQRQYANAAHHLDRSFAQLWQFLVSRDRHRDTIVAIVGDHPDSFYENGLLGHAWSVDEHQRRTPLFVVNGVGSRKVPIGQDEVAGIVLDSLGPHPSPGKLEFRLDPDKRVFVLTGKLEQPRQIAWASEKDLITYDFKTGLTQLSQQEPWLKPSQLDSRDHRFRLFEDLVHRWERELYVKTKRSL